MFLCWIIIAKVCVWRGRGEGWKYLPTGPRWGLNRTIPAKHLAQWLALSKDLDCPFGAGSPHSAPGWSLHLRSHACSPPNPPALSAAGT